MRFSLRSSLIAFLVVAVYSSPSAFSQGGSTNPFDRMIPSEALLYWGYEGDNSLKIDFPNHEKAMEIWVNLMGEILEWRIIQDEFTAILNKIGIEEGFSALSGDSSCFALYPLIEGTPLPGIGLYVTQVKNPEKADQVLSSFMEEIGRLIPALQTMKDEYYGYWIRSLYGPFMLPGLDLSYALKDSTLMISNSKSLLLRTIDRIEEDQGFLADVDNYQQAIADLPADRFSTFYINTAEMNSTGSVLLKNLQALQQLQVGVELDDAMPFIQGIIDFLGVFQSYTSTQSLDSEGRLVKTSFTRLNLSQSNDIVRTMINRDPKSFAFERYLPRKVGTVSSGNVLGPKDLWILLENFLAEFPPIQDYAHEILSMVRAWEDESGFSIENDLFAWIGDSWCLIRPVMDLDTIVATNQGAILLEVNDAEKALAGIDKLVDLLIKTYGLPVVIEKETYQTTQITSMTLPIPLIPITPCWCIHNKSLIISTRPNMIREMLDINAGSRNGIERNQQYKYLQDAIQIPANKISFQDNESEFYAFREAMRKVGSIPELAQNLPQEYRALPGFFLDRASYLMNCWQRLRGTVKRTTFNSDRIVTEKVFLYRDIRAVPPSDSVSHQKVSLGTKNLIALLADYSCKQGDTERAIRLYRQLVDFFPQGGDYLSQLGNIYKIAGHTEEAQAMYDSLLEKTPKTAYVIGRENLFDDATADQIISRVRETSAKTLGIREDAALFGIALEKRDTDKAALASDLFQEIVQSPKTASAIALASKNEKALLSGDPIEGMITVPFTPNAPEIDGVMEEELWSQTEAILFQDENENEKIGVRLLRDEANLYIGMSGSTTKTAKQVRVLLCPSRDYTHIEEFAIQREPENRAVSSRIRSVQDPYSLTLDQSPPANTESFNLGALPLILRSIEQALHHKGNDLGDLGDHEDLPVFQFPTETYPVSWTIENNDKKAGLQEECLEAAIPLNALLKVSRMDQSIWLFNVVRTFENDPTETHQSLRGTNQPNDPFYYLYLQIR